MELVALLLLLLIPVLRKWVKEGRHLPRQFPQRRIEARNAKKLINSWHLMEDEGISKTISIRVGSGPAINTNAGLYWHYL